MTIGWLFYFAKKLNSGCNDFHISSIIVITDFDRMKEKQKCLGAVAGHVKYIIGGKGIET